MEFMHDPLVALLAIFIIAAVIYYRLLVVTNKLTKRSIIVFSRYPVKSRSKTRLIPDLGPTGAAETQLYMTEHLIDRVVKFCEKNSDVGVYIYYHDGESDQVEYWLGRRAQNIRLTALPQVGENLGVRLKNSAEQCFDQGDESVVIVGSDIPGIDGSILSEAFDSIASPNGTATVLGAAKDGGYYLIGLTNQCRSSLSVIFDNLDWGTEKIFRQQVDKINQTGLSLHLLSKELNDVDLIEDMPVFEREVGVSRSQLKHPTWSIIIPVLNEENSIVETIETIIKQCSDLKNIEEIIVSDGGSIDSSVEKVKQFAKATEGVKIDVVNSPPGRGNQLYTGAKHATGGFLLFLHADTILPSDFHNLALKSLMVPGNSLVTFSFQLDLTTEHRKHQWSWWFLFQIKVIQYFANLRSSKLELPYGDQSFCMRKFHYDSLGGFDRVYLLEDVLMVQKSKRIGHIVTLPEAVITSGRRWENFGAFRVSFLNSLIMVAYKMGVSPDTLALWYYGDKLRKIIEQNKEKAD